MNDYYKTCAFPKPQDKKKKRLQNGYKNKHKRMCAYCGEYGADRHEIFGGALRQLSMELGFQVDVCRSHHAELHNNSTVWAKAENRRLKQQCQESYMQKLTDTGIEEKKALEIWMRVFGKNYLEGEIPE